jgi:hypothetical protein
MTISRTKRITIVALVAAAALLAAPRGAAALPDSPFATDIGAVAHGRPASDQGAP